MQAAFLLLQLYQKNPPAAAIFSPIALFDADHEPPLAVTQELVGRQDATRNAKLVYLTVEERRLRA